MTFAEQERPGNRSDLHLGGHIQGMHVEDNPGQEELKVPDWEGSETRRPYLAAEIVYSLFGRPFTVMVNDNILALSGSLAGPALGQLG